MAFGSQPWRVVSSEKYGIGFSTSLMEAGEERRIEEGIVYVGV